MSRETATYTCPSCRRQIRVLADEYGDHPCGCGWAPYQDMIGADVEAYVDYCRKIGAAPDSFAFALTHQRKYGHVPGRVLNELITKEMTKSERGSAQVYRHCTDGTP